MRRKYRVTPRGCALGGAVTDARTELSPPYFVLRRDLVRRRARSVVRAADPRMLKRRTRRGIMKIYKTTFEIEISLRHVSYLCSSSRLLFFSIDNEAERSLRYNIVVRLH
ncbi:hypothetical protein EVAR_102402_1 [Eumeta japonica]|uniref:Uncharacterized protein n=1 Tax=Eumeta variegata TaxID=151549 RepID=A0A4C1SLK1_EUMVA|nr:hypothetical protein EVAR_102402_1 [Eumeta japonica]